MRAQNAKPVPKRPAPPTLQDKRPRTEQRIVFAHAYDEPFDPVHATGSRIVIKSTDLTLLKDDVARALGTPSPVRYLATPTGIPITDIASMANHSHVYAWIKNIRPRHPPPGGTQLLHHFKHGYDSGGADSPDSSSISSPVVHSPISNPAPMFMPHSPTNASSTSTSTASRKSSLSELLRRHRNPPTTTGSESAGPDSPSSDHSESAAPASFRPSPAAPPSRIAKRVGAKLKPSDAPSSALPKLATPSIAPSISPSIALKRPSDRSRVSPQNPNASFPHTSDFPPDISPKSSTSSQSSRSSSPITAPSPMLASFLSKQIASSVASPPQSPRGAFSPTQTTASAWDPTPVSSFSFDPSPSSPVSSVSSTSFANSQPQMPSAFMPPAEFVFCQVPPEAASDSNKSHEGYIHESEMAEHIQRAIENAFAAGVLLPGPAFNGPRPKAPDTFDFDATVVVEEVTAADTGAKEECSVFKVEEPIDTDDSHHTPNYYHADRAATQSPVTPPMSPKFGFVPAQVATPVKERAKLAWFVMKQLKTVLESNSDKLPEDVALWVSRIEAITDTEPDSDFDNYVEPQHHQQHTPSKESRRLSEAEREIQALRSSLSIAESDLQLIRAANHELEQAKTKYHDMMNSLHSTQAADAGQKEVAQQLLRERETLALRVKKAEEELLQTKKEFEVKMKFRDRRMENTKRTNETTEAVVGTLTKTQSRERQLRHALSSLQSLVRVEKDPQVVHHRLLQWMDKNKNEFGDHAHAVTAPTCEHCMLMTQCIALVDSHSMAATRREAVTIDDLHKELESRNKELDACYKAVATAVAHLNAMHTTHDMMSSQLDMHKRIEKFAGNPTQELSTLRAKNAQLQQTSRSGLRHLAESLSSKIVSVEQQSTSHVQTLEARTQQLHALVVKVTQNLAAKSAAWAEDRKKLTEATKLLQQKIASLESERADSSKSMQFVETAVETHRTRFEEEIKLSKQRVTESEAQWKAEKIAMQRKWDVLTDEKLEEQKQTQEKAMQKLSRDKDQLLAKREAELRELVTHAESTLQSVCLEKDSLLSQIQVLSHDIIAIRENNIDFEQRLDAAHKALMQQKSEAERATTGMTKSLEQAFAEARSRTEEVTKLQKQISEKQMVESEVADLRKQISELEAASQSRLRVSLPQALGADDQNSVPSTSTSTPLASPSPSCVHPASSSTMTPALLSPTVAGLSTKRTLDTFTLQNASSSSFAADHQSQQQPSSPQTPKVTLLPNHIPQSETRSPSSSPPGTSSNLSSPTSPNAGPVFPPFTTRTRASLPSISASSPDALSPSSKPASPHHRRVGSAPVPALAHIASAEEISKFRDDSDYNRTSNSPHPSSPGGGHLTPTWKVDPRVEVLSASDSLEQNVVIDQDLNSALDSMFSSTNLAKDVPRYLIFDCSRAHTSVFLCTNVGRTQALESLDRRIASLAYYLSSDRAPELQNFLKQVATRLCPSHVVFGLTHWFQTQDSQLQLRIQSHIEEFARSCHLKSELIHITRPQISGFEAIAVQYAASMTGLPHFNIQITTEDGAVRILVSEDQSVMRNFTVDQGFDQGKDLLIHHGPIALPEIRKMWSSSLGHFKSGQSSISGLPIKNGKCLATGWCCSAAKFVQFSNDNSPKRCEAVVVALEAAADELIAPYRSHQGIAVRPQDAYAISCLIGHSCVFSELVDLNSEIYFRDNWYVGGRQFTSTWPVGWFLSREEGKTIETIYSNHASSTTSSFPPKLDYSPSQNGNELAQSTVSEIYLNSTNSEHVDTDDDDEKWSHTQHHQQHQQQQHHQTVNTHTKPNYADNNSNFDELECAQHQQQFSNGFV